MSFDRIFNQKLVQKFDDIIDMDDCTRLDLEPIRIKGKPVFGLPNRFCGIDTEIVDRNYKRIKNIRFRTGDDESVKPYQGN